jgi:hypothetical protein
MNILNKINWASQKLLVEYSYLDLECFERLCDSLEAHAVEDIEEEIRLLESNQCEDFRIEKATPVSRLEADLACQVDFDKKVILRTLKAIGNNGPVGSFQELLGSLNSLVSSYEDALRVMRWVAELRVLPWQITLDYEALLLQEDSPWYSDLEERYLYEYFPEEEEDTRAVLASQVYGSETGLEYIFPTKHNLLWTPEAGFLINFGLYDLKEEEILLQLDDHGLYVHWSTK